jgi:hypothetical protein
MSSSLVVIAFYQQILAPVKVPQKPENQKRGDGMSPDIYRDQQSLDQAPA